MIVPPFFIYAHLYYSICPEITSCRSSYPSSRSAILGWACFICQLLVDSFGMSCNLAVAYTGCSFPEFPGTHELFFHISSREPVWPTRVTAFEVLPAIWQERPPLLPSQSPTRSSQRTKLESTQQKFLQPYTPRTFTRDTVAALRTVSLGVFSLFTSPLLFIFTSYCLHFLRLFPFLPFSLLYSNLFLYILSGGLFPFSLRANPLGNKLACLLGFRETTTASSSSYHLAQQRFLQ
ncbi:hypothetical protein V8F20_000143 [Naviculisporaceae sp. PSN 640]